MDESTKEVVLQLGSYAFWLTLIYLLRKPLSDFIPSIKKFLYKNGNNEITLETKDSNVEKDHDLKEIKKVQGVEEIIDESKEEDKEFKDVLNAIENNNISFAVEIFMKGNFNFEEECFYLYKRYLKNDMEVINIFNKKIKQLVDSEEKRTYVFWLATCFSETNQYEKIYVLYNQNIDNTEDNESKSRLRLRLSIFYKNNKNIEKAKLILIDILNSNISNIVKAEVYLELISIEEELGNSKISDFCKDKLAELSPLNTSYLFDSAFKLNDNYKGLQLLNYEKLLDLDPKNQNGLNNYGVTLSNYELDILSINNYKKSSDLENTLAMSNQGYKLLNSGFLDEALALANKAIDSNDVHDNIYKLLDSIKTKEKKEKETLNKLRDKYKKYQSYVRKYLEKYYMVNTLDISNWYYEGQLFDFSPNSKGEFSIEFSYENEISLYEVKMNGKIHNSTLNFDFSEKDLHPNGLLSLNRSKKLLGYHSESENKIILFSESEDDDYYKEFNK